MKKILTAIVVFLFLGLCLVPTYSGIIVSKPFIAGSNGETLYVGGEGPGNYTHIQDAIDNASDGDTVCVYDDSSPYNENVLVYKSINLIGEDRNTTIIDGNKAGNAVEITANEVNISEFTILNYGDEAIDILSDNAHISRNNLGPNLSGFSGYGIRLYQSYGNIISDNYISNTFTGINILSSSEMSSLQTSCTQTGLVVSVSLVLLITLFQKILYPQVLLLMH